VSERRKSDDGKMEVGLLPATEMVGQQFVALLGHHLWFR
jgi:aspartate-semialdehyde dehydrogenase